MEILTPIPAQVLTQVKAEITPFGYSAKDEAKLYGKLLALWFTIYAAQQREKILKEDDFHNSSYDNLYGPIPRQILNKFKVRINGHLYQYTHLLSILENAQVIKINNKYSVGRFTKSYRPHEDISYDKISTVHLDLKVFIDFMSKNNTREEKLAEYPDLAKHINTVYDTSIDLDQAFQIIADSDMKTKAKYEYQIRALKFGIGIHFFTEASTGRLYTSVANFPKLLLPALRLYGAPLIEVDIVNSQPLLLAALVNVEEFTADVEAGVYYDRLGELMGKTRDEIKLYTFQLLFTPTYIRKKTDIEAMECLYPNLVLQLNSYKYESGKAALKAAKDPNNIYTRLWFKLQALEADIVITAVEALDIPALTRHDSILIQATEDPQCIINELLREFNEQTDLNPSFRVTNYSK